MASSYLCWPCGAAHCWDDGYCSALSWAAPPQSSLQVYSALCRGVHAWPGVPGSGSDWSGSVFRGRGCRGAQGMSLKGASHLLFHTHFHGHHLLIYCSKAQKGKISKYMQTQPHLTVLLVLNIKIAVPAGSFARWGAGLCRGWGAGAETAIRTAEGTHSLHVQRACACFTLWTALTPVKDHMPLNLATRAICRQAKQFNACLSTCESTNDSIF